MVSGGHFASRTGDAVHLGYAALSEAAESRVGDVDLADMQRWIMSLGKAIGAEHHLLPTFGHSEDLARPHIEIEDGQIVYAVVERGREIDREVSGDPVAILARTFFDATASMASSWEAAHRDHSEDNRRALFAKQLCLLGSLDPVWADQKTLELGGRLADVGLDPEDACGLVALRERPPMVVSPRGFRLYNVARKVTKAADRLGFVDGESVVAAAMTFPVGHKKATAVRMGAGGVAAMSSAPPASVGAAARMPGGQHFLAVTNRRLLVTTVRSVSTNPKELVGEWPLEKVASISAECGFMAATITVRFRDGTSFQLDGARSSGAEELEHVFGHGSITG